MDEFILKPVSWLPHRKYFLALPEVLLVLVFLASVFLLLQYHWKRRRMYRMAAKLTGPICFPIIGSAHLFLGSTESILATIMNLCDSYSLPAKVWLGNRLYFGVSEPEHLEIIFNHPKAVNKDKLVELIQPILGEGLFSAPADKWKKNRKIIAPAFNQRILNDFVAVFTQQAALLESILEKRVGAEIDLSHYVGKCILDIVCETTMGVKVNAQVTESKFLHWVDLLLGLAFQRMFQIWYHSDLIFYNSAMGREFKTALKKFINYTNQVVVEKKALYQKKKKFACDYPEAETEEAKKMKTFLDLLLELTEEGEIFTNDQLRDEVNTFLIGGSDTTTSVMGFVGITLGMFPDLQEKVYEEVVDVLGTDRPADFKDLPNLKYTERFIYETLRLFPLGGVVVRSHEDDIQLGKCTLPAGSSSIICVIHTHRSGKYWPDPLKFDPDRFLPEEVAKRHPYSFVPFSGGPRNCIGKKYGMMMLKCIIAQLVRRFRFSTPYQRIEDVRIKQDFIMKPVDGYRVKLQLRE